MQLMIPTEGNRARRSKSQLDRLCRVRKTEVVARRCVHLLTPGSTRGPSRGATSWHFTFTGPRQPPNSRSGIITRARQGLGRCLPARRDVRGTIHGLLPRAAVRARRPRVSQVRGAERGQQGFASIATAKKRPDDLHRSHGCAAQAIPGHQETIWRAGDPARAERE